MMLYGMSETGAGGRTASLARTSASASDAM